MVQKITIDWEKRNISFQSDYPPRYTAKTDVFALGLILTELCVVIKNDEERYEVSETLNNSIHQQ